jgi:hypothetical protein
VAGHDDETVQAVAMATAAAMAAVRASAVAAAPTPAAPLSEEAGYDLSGDGGGDGGKGAAVSPFQTPGICQPDVDDLSNFAESGQWEQWSAGDVFSDGVLRTGDANMPRSLMLVRPEDRAVVRMVMDTLFDLQRGSHIRVRAQKRDSYYYVVGRGYKGTIHPSYVHRLTDVINQHANFRDWTPVTFATLSFAPKDGEPMLCVHVSMKQFCYAGRRVAIAPASSTNRLPGASGGVKKPQRRAARHADVQAQSFWSLRGLLSGLVYGDDGV